MPLTEVFGGFEPARMREFAAGLLLGAALMLAPAFILGVTGSVRWQPGGADGGAVGSALLLMAGVALTEELLFRGFLFQRLIGGLGFWPAQIIVGGFFVLTHLGNPGMDGDTRVWASVNIFAASVLFGLAYGRTRSLAMPVALHFAANVTQGVLLGFGVSGGEQPSLLIPRFTNDLDWLTGGEFGLEASLPGLLAVIGAVGLLAWRRNSGKHQALADEHTSRTQARSHL